MGRPISKKWFADFAGSVAGNLRLLCNTGTEGTRVIESQTGTNTYRVVTAEATKLVRLVNKTDTPLLGEAILLHNGLPVRKLTQYRVYYWDTNTADTVWRTQDGTVIGTFSPTLSVENDEPGAPTPRLATGVVVMDTGVAETDDDTVVSVTITDSGVGYTTAPTVTFSDSTASVGATTAIGTATINGIGEVTSVTITDPGVYADGEVPTVTFSAP